LINLLENALKYTPAGSAIEIRAAVRGDGIEVVVSDRGPRVSADQHARVDGTPPVLLHEESGRGESG
jgi:two-component system sensor histidine kinase KdpD